MAGSVRGRGSRRVAVTAEDAAEAEKAVLVGSRLTASAKGCLFRRPARVLLPVLHLLKEEGGLLFVDKGQAGEALLNLKGVEEGAVLVVVPRVEDFLVPYHASVRGLASWSVQVLSRGVPRR